MTVLLAAPSQLPPSDRYDVWIAIGDAPAALPADKALDVPARRFEAAVDATFDDWVALAKMLGGDSVTAELGHTATCNTNVSDLGTMLAWTRLASSFEAEARTILIVCDDPWIFRHLAESGHRALGSAPGLVGTAIKLALRGLAARTWYALHALFAALFTRAAPTADGAPAIMVYGHPASDSDGQDAYFGDLMRWVPSLQRVMHVDCRPARAAALAADGRTQSLHGYGSPLHALTLPFKYWRPTPDMMLRPERWLISRAAAIEGANGQAAAIAWQQHCQRRWLARQRPSMVLWPWENHGWERDFVRAAKSQGVGTIGYQHTVVGRRHWVHAYSNADGTDSLPDRIACNGPAWMDVLTGYGIPSERMFVAGALRFAEPKQLKRDSAAPVFVALPFAHAIAGHIMDAVADVAAEGRRKFAVASHPMNPYPIQETASIRSANGPLSETPAAAVIYAATTVGLEARLGGLPVIRLIPPGNGSVDVVPEQLDIAAAAREDLSEVLERVIDAQVPAADFSEFFRPPDAGKWRRWLDGAPATD